MTPRTTRSFLPYAARTLLALLLLAGSACPATVVAIVKGKDVDKMVAEAIDLLGGIKQFVKDGQKVVIKPNVVHQPAVTGGPWERRNPQIRPEFTTDVRIVRALAQEMLKAARCTVTVAEGTPEDLSRLYEFLGYTRMAKDLGIQLVDVDRAERTTVRVDGLAYKEYSLPVVTQTCDVLVNAPAMKTHQLGGVTLGMKNFFGLLPMPKSRFHAKVHAVLCDLTLARKPDLVVIDGLVAMEGQGPLQGTPVVMDLIIAGRDVVAVDAVATAVMGFDPRRVQCLRLAGEANIGESDLQKITVKGVPIHQVRRQFQHAWWEAEASIPKTHARVGKLLEIAERAYKDHGDERHRHESIVATFPADQLKVDSARYPTRRSRGFRARVPCRGDTIFFHIPYKVLFEENGRAAVDEVEAWVHRNLGEDIEVRKNPSGLGD